MPEGDASYKENRLVRRFFLFLVHQVTAWLPHVVDELAGDRVVKEMASGAKRNEICWVIAFFAGGKRSVT